MDKMINFLNHSHFVFNLRSIYLEVIKTQFKVALAFRLWAFARFTCLFLQYKVHKF